MPQLLLLEHNHIDFQSWLLKALQDLPEEAYFSKAGLRVEYLNLCWKEEELWGRWSASTCNCFSYPKVLSADCPVHQGEIFERSKNVESG
jgi:hypothetical protein